MSENPLFDGTLSIKVAGVEYAAYASALQYETVAPGGFGAASFEVYPTDPFDVGTTFPELVNGAVVVAKHGAVGLYEGEIVGDPTVAKLENGESVIVVECGGILDKAKRRQDFGYTAIDTTYDNWARHRLSDKAFQETIDGKLRLDVNEAVTLSSGDIAALFYRVNQGIVPESTDAALCLDFAYDLLLAGATWHCDIWASPYYVDSLDAGDWTTGLWAQANTTVTGTAHVTGLPADTRCVAFVCWTSGAGSTAAKKHMDISDLRLNCYDAAGTTPTVDTAMVYCGIVGTGLATGADLETIGEPLAQCLIPPSTTHADALDKLASMYEEPLDWGFYDASTLRIKKRLSSPLDNVAIRALAGAGTEQAAYLFDATTPAIDYDVHKYEEGAMDYVRAIFTQGSRNRVNPSDPAGNFWPSTWARSGTTTANAGRYKMVADAWPTPGLVSNLGAFSSDSVHFYATCHIVATVPAGSTITVKLGSQWDGGASTTTVHTETIAGPVTNGAYDLGGDCVIPAGHHGTKLAVDLNRTVGSGTCTVYATNLVWHDDYPEGMLRAICAPTDPPADADVKVGLLDLTGRGNVSVDRAFATATQALAWVASTLETGTITVFSPTVPIYSGGTKNAAYMRASDWGECAQVAGHAPLWISSSLVDVDAGTTTLTIEPYPFDVAESDFGHEHMRALRRWHKARRGIRRRQLRAIQRAQAKENKIKLGKTHKHRIHYI